MIRFLALIFAPELHLWRGKGRLRFVFWMYGVLVSAGLIFSYAGAALQARILLQQAILLCFGIFTTWLLVAIWRCARNEDCRLRVVAHWVVIPWALNAAFVIAFLEVDILSKFLKG
jgi:hypothetical protein